MNRLIENLHREFGTEINEADCEVVKDFPVWLYYVDLGKRISNLFFDEQVCTSDHRIILEIRKLPALKELTFTPWPQKQGSPVSLSPSIGMLQSLEKLHLGERNVGRLPQEIGNLENLKELTLSDNPLSSLPNSIRNLKNLTCLRMNGTNITVLPSEFSGLTNLESLRLDKECILHPLPNLLKLEILVIVGSFNSLDELQQLSNLQNLPKLRILCCSVKESLDARETFLDLAQNTPSLTLIGNRRSPYKFNIPELAYPLACNNLNSRTSFCGSSEDSTVLSEKLWPLMLSNATRAFGNLRYFVEKRESSERGVDAPNAVYRMLLVRREFFVSILLDRSRRKRCASIRLDRKRNETEKMFENKLEALTLK